MASPRDSHGSAYAAKATAVYFSIDDGPAQRKHKCHNIGEDSKEAMNTFKRVLGETIGELTETEDLRLLVVGRTGEGKSTLINSIIEMGGEVAKEGAHANRCTEEVQQYLYSDVIPGINVTVIDSPGLQDIHNIEQSYIHVMKNLCEDVNLILYCMKMTNHRLINDDRLAMQKFHQAFGPKFWERVVFVFTFANKEDCEQRDSRDEPSKVPPLENKAAWRKLKKTRFIGRVKLRALEVKEFLKKSISADMDVEKIHFLPAGCYVVLPSCPDPLQLPDGENWLYKLLKFCCCQIQSTHLFKKLSLRDNIHLAIIIDNDSEVTTDSGQIITLNGQAKEMKEGLEKLGYCVLYFNGISFESFACLMKAFQCVDHSELASFALVILSKGKTHHVYDVNNEQILFEDVFDIFVSNEKFFEVPKLFFLHFSHPKTPKDKLAFNVNLPTNSISLIVSRKRLSQSFNSPVLQAFTKNLKSSKPLKKFFQELQDAIEGDEFATSKPVINTLTDDYVLPTPYEPSTPRKKKNYLKKQLHFHRTLWHPVRCNTVDVLLSAKEKVSDVVRKERITKVAASSTSLVVGGSLVAVGLALAPFTFGASLGLSIAGGVVGGIAGASGLAAFITSKVMSNSELKKAQQQVHLDQQLTQSLNGIATEYSELLKSWANEVADEVAAGVGSGAATMSRIGAAAAAGAEGVAETSAIALRTTGRVVGMALAGVSLAVTVPLDIGMIAYNSYLLHTSSQDKSGKSDRNKIIQWIAKQTEEMLKGTFISVDSEKYEIEGSQAIKFDDRDHECGYKVLVSANTLAEDEKSTISVRTVISGPFDLPEGATLVSAVYDVLMDEKLQAPVTIEIEHCVDITNQSTAEKMTFAMATVDFDKKVFVFTPLEGGTFSQGQTHGSISLSDSSLLCILYYSESLKDQLVIKYAAQCLATKECKNFQKMDIKFTKLLSAHYKHIQIEVAPDPVRRPSISFRFTKPSTIGDLPCIELEKMEHKIEKSGWIISHHALPCDVYQQVLNTAELQDFSKPRSSEIFPSLTLDIQVEDEETASDEMKTIIDLKGTDLQLLIVGHKDPDLRRTYKPLISKDLAFLKSLIEKYVTVPTKKLKVHCSKFANKVIPQIEKHSIIIIIIIINAFMLIIMSYLV